LLSPSDLARWKADGFLAVPQLLSTEEATLVRAAAKRRQSEVRMHRVLDDERRSVNLWMWNQLDDDVFGMISRSRRVVDRMEQLLEGEVYHYHSKVNMKEPHESGRWVWHQDYDYWYYRGCLLPDMGSCFIALDRCTAENGCLQVMRASHLMGRLDHVDASSSQRAADPARVEQVLQRLDVVTCELEPGDAVFFHANTLHSSGPNTSDQERWVMLCCYNTARNDPYLLVDHPRYTPLDKVEDDKVTTYARQAALS